MGRLYDGYKVAYQSANQVQQFRGGMADDISRIQPELMDRYERVAQALPELDEVVSTAPFIQGVDDEKWADIRSDADKHLNQWGEREDLENIGGDVARYARKVTGQLTNLAKQQANQQKYNASLDEKGLELPKRVKQFYQAQALDAYKNNGGGTVDKYGRPTNNYGGPKPVAHVDNNKKVREVISIAMPEIDGSTLVQDGVSGRWRAEVNGKVEWLDGNKISKAIKDGINSDANWRESIDQDISASTYLETRNLEGLEDEEITDFINTKADDATKVAYNKMLEGGVSPKEALRNARQSVNSNKLYGSIYGYGHSKAYQQTTDKTSHIWDAQYLYNDHREKENIDEQTRYDRNRADKLADDQANRDYEDGKLSEDFILAPGLTTTLPAHIKTIEDLEKGQGGINEVSTNIKTLESELAILENSRKGAEKQGTDVSEFDVDINQKRQQIEAAKSKRTQLTNIRKRAYDRASAELYKGKNIDKAVVEPELDKLIANELKRSGTKNIFLGVDWRDNKTGNIYISPKRYKKLLMEGKYEIETEEYEGYDPGLASGGKRTKHRSFLLIDGHKIQLDQGGHARKRNENMGIRMAQSVSSMRQGTGGSSKLKEIRRRAASYMKQPISSQDVQVSLTEKAKLQILNNPSLYKYANSDGTDKLPEDLPEDMDWGKSVISSGVNTTSGFAEVTPKNSKGEPAGDKFLVDISNTTYGNSIGRRVYKQGVTQNNPAMINAGKTMIYKINKPILNQLGPGASVDKDLNGTPLQVKNSSGALVPISIERSIKNPANLYIKNKNTGNVMLKNGKPLMATDDVLLEIYSGNGG